MEWKLQNKQNKHPCLDTDGEKKKAAPSIWTEPNEWNLFWRRNEEGYASNSLIFFSFL